MEQTQTTQPNLNGKSEKVRKTSERVLTLHERAQQKRAELQTLIEQITAKKTYLEKNGVQIDELSFWEQELNGSGSGKEHDSSLKPVSNGVHEFTNPELYIRTVDVDYVEVGDEFDLFDTHYESGEALLLEGPKGCGKSLAIAKWCSLRGLPFITFDCSEGTKEGHLIGRLIVQGEETPFHLGILPTILKVADKFGGAVIIFEELNALTQPMQKLLNGILDWRKSVFIEHIGEHVHLKEGTKLLIMATMNPSSYGGVNELNDDLLSRFTRQFWDYPVLSAEKKLLNTKGIPADVVKHFLKLAQDTRASEKKRNVTHSISTRELDSCFNLYRAWSSRVDNPLSKLINGKIRGMYADEDEWNYVKSRIESIFGREVFNEALKQMSDEEIEETESMEVEQ